MKRIFDFVVSVFLLCALTVPMVIIAILIKLTSPGPVLFWSHRVGQQNSLFRMPKFRSMRIETPQLATHLLTNADEWITPIGRVLRSTSLDELPQLWSVLLGDMSLIGPRPALFNQDDLVALRTKCGVHRVRPGLTGWAQVNGRDELPIPQKVGLDSEYVMKQSLLFDLKILALTVVKVLRREGVSQSDGETLNSDSRDSTFNQTPKRRAA